jgi:hypothetical protein
MEVKYKCPKCGVLIGGEVNRPFHCNICYRWNANGTKDFERVEVEC